MELTVDKRYEHLSGFRGYIERITSRGSVVFRKDDGSVGIYCTKDFFELFTEV